MIVFCHLLNDRSGSPTVLRATLDALSASEPRRMLFVGSQGRGVLEEARVPTRRYWYHRSKYRVVTLITYLASQVALFRALCRAQEIPIDATVYINTLLPFGGMIWGRLTGRRVVIHVHENSIAPKMLCMFLTACAARCAGTLIYVSNDHKKRMPISGPASRVVVTNPVSSAIAVCSGNHATWRQGGVFRVLMLASLRVYKGLEEFMELATALRERTDIGFELVLNAAPKEVATFKERNTHMENVLIHECTDNPASFYARADLVVNLSRVDQWIETFGLTLAEAMTFGIPVIAPPLGGPVELVTHGVQGYCIDSRDSSALIQAVIEMADNVEMHARMSRAAQERAEDFTFDAYAISLRAALSEPVTARSRSQ